VIKHQKIHKQVKMIVTPTSSGVYQKAVEKGVLDTLTGVGALIQGPSCGSCFWVIGKILHPDGL